MANKVSLFQRPNKKFELEINSLVCKSDYTSTTIKGVVAETNTFLATAEGIERLSGVFNSLDPNIQYLNSVDSTSFDGTNYYKIAYINQSA